MIANQLHREHRNLDSLYRTAKLYCEEQRIESFVSKRESINFTFNDGSKLRIERGSCGALIWAGTAD
jgi:hypothetical protein